MGLHARNVLDRLRGEHGFALVLALGTMVVLSAMVTTVVYYSSTSAKASSYQLYAQRAYGLAESGVAAALSSLNNSANPNLATAVPTCPGTTQTVSTGVTYTFCGALSGSTWTLTGTGTIRNPNLATKTIARTLTRIVTIKGTNAGATAGAWNRIYSDATGNCSFNLPKGIPIQGSFAARGDVCLNGSAITGSTSIVQIGGKLTLTPDNAGVNDQEFPLTPSGSGWTNPGNISASDNTNASQTVAPGATGTSIVATGFGYALPANAVILGIAVKIHRQASVDHMLEDASVRLLKGGVPVGNDLAAATIWGPGYGDDNVGGNNTLSGSTWTPGDIDSSGFGVSLSVKNVGAGSSTAGVDYIQATVTYSQDAGIGGNGAPVQEADIGGTCTWSNQGTHTPCTSADHVFAGTIGTPPTLTKPTVDWTYWYTNAAPGPKHGCDTHTGTPPVFDSDSIYDGTTPAQDITPEAAGDPHTAGGTTATPDKSYTCIAKDAQGNIIGQLSWNMVTRVLTVSGTVFFDGDAKFHHDGGFIVHYQGRGTIFIAGKSEITEAICAGGSGYATTCQTEANISTWDPTQNLLFLVIGSKNGADDLDFHSNFAAFQGALYVADKCHLHDSAMMSGPVICSTFQIDGANPGLYAWPSLTSLLPGEIDADPATATVFAATLGNQSG